VFHTNIVNNFIFNRLAVKVVIPWRGFRCFTLTVPPVYSGIETRQSCNPLAGIQVFHTMWLSRRSSTTREECCNPLAGIQVFHTFSASFPGSDDFPGEVVIPWRGFRCFTPSWADLPR